MFDLLRSFHTTHALLRLCCITVGLLVALASMSARAEAEIITVNAGGDLQAALDAAQPGDEIVLQAGATFTGTYILRNKNTTGEAWITIKSSRLSDIPEGVRVNPLDAPKMAKIGSDGYGAAAIVTEPGAHHWRLLGLEVAPKDAQAFVYDVIALGSGGTAQDTLDEVPHHFIIDRTYIHSYAGIGTKRGLALNSAYTDVTNSYFSEFKVAGQDSQAIMGWNGPGPFKIINNYLEGAGENILFGGGDASIPGLIPSDIEIRRNHLFKPLSWKYGHPTFPGGTVWQVKNLFELKNARRVIVEGNLMENNWTQAQTGYGVFSQFAIKTATTPGRW
jgi:hypothetical protein